MSDECIGIMAAMPEEIEGVVKLIEHPKEVSIGNRIYTKGTIENKKVVVVFSRWGKVAAASTVTTLIDMFNVNKIIFTGIAGALQEDLNVGDLVIASRCVFHDMDTRPLNERYVVPLLDKKYFELDCDDSILHLLKNTFSLENLLIYVNEKWIETFSLHSVKVIKGSIASGDQFVNSELARNEIISNLPDVVCVEMEGAAVAQVCYEHNVSCLLIRTISDNANNSAAVDFEPFAKHVASNYSVAIISSILKN